VPEDKIFELTVDAGANECFSNEYFHEIQCNKNEIYNVKKKLEKNIYNFLSTEIEWVPLNKIEVSIEEKDKIVNFLETLEEDEDVQNIYTNANL
jgi:transcriptional/translational regulatory protein YebC/TACO1